MIKDQNLFRFREDLSYIVVDTETEGLSLGGFSRPWEVALSIVENKRIIKNYQKFPFIHDLKVSADAARITRFNYEEYRAKSEPAEEVYSLFCKYLFDPKYYIVGINLLNFDIYQISALQKYLNKKVDYSYIDRIYDVLALGRAWKLNMSFPEQKEDILPWQWSLCNFRKKGLKASLDQLCKDFEIPVEQEKRHIAEYDNFLCNEVFKQLIFKLEVW